MELYEKNADGSGEEHLLFKSDQDKTPTSWSRDGKFLLFNSQDPKTNTDIWVLQLDSLKPFVFLKTEFQEGRAQFSPDRRWIAYTSFQSGTAQVYVRPFSGDSAQATAGSQQSTVSTQSGIYPQWSGDGKKLFYVSLNSDFSVVDIPAGATFHPSPPRRLFGEVPPAVYGVSPAADKFLFAGLPPSSGTVPPFTIVLNWTSHLKGN